MNRLNRSYIKISMILTICIWLIFMLKKYNIFTVEQLNLHKHALMYFVNEHYVLSVILFILSYILFTALMLPGAFVLSLAGGLLFGVLPGTTYITLGATIGACCAFLATRYFFGNTLQQKYHKAFKHFNTAIEQHGVAYLFIVRLVPFFPFFLVNLLAGLSTVSTKHFVITTALGIIPLVFGFTFLGSQLRYTETIQDFFTYPLTVAGILLLGIITLQKIAQRWRNH